MNYIENEEKEKNFYLDPNTEIALSLKETESGMVLETNVFSLLPEALCKPIDTNTLGIAFEPEQKFENPDGSPICFDTDYFGEKREDTVLPGPFAKGKAEMTVFQFSEQISL